MQYAVRAVPAVHMVGLVPSRIECVSRRDEEKNPERFIYQTVELDLLHLAMHVVYAWLSFAVVTLMHSTAGEQ